MKCKKGGELLIIQVRDKEVKREKDLDMVK